MRMCKQLIKVMLTIGLFLSIVLLNTATSGDRMEGLEYEIKAAYLYNFISFTTWPEKPAGDTISIGILGRDPFGSHFSGVEGKFFRSNNMKLKIRRFVAFADADELKKCQLLFISRSEVSRIDKILAGVKDASVLTVAEFEGFLKVGGMIKLINYHGKIRWEINRTSVNASGVRLSAQLFQSAIRVVE